MTPTSNSNSSGITIPKIGTLVLVEWLDSKFQSGWNYKEPGVALRASPRKIRTVAWLTGRSNTAIATANHISDGSSEELEGHLNPVAIPIGCITSIKELSP